MKMVLSCDLKGSPVPTIFLRHSYFIYVYIYMNIYSVCTYMYVLHVCVCSMYLNVSTSLLSTTTFVIYIIDLTPFVQFLCKTSNWRY